MKAYKFGVVLLLTAVGPAPLWAASLLDANLSAQTIFSETYTTTGANSSVFGNVLAGGVSTTGAHAGVFGNLVSAGAANAGAGSTTSGNIVTGGVATTGAGAMIGGNVTASGAATVGASSRVAGYVSGDGAVTTGASSNVGGFVQSGGAVGTGANSTVVGAVSAVGAISVGAGGTIGSSQVLTVQPFDASLATAALITTANTAANSVLTAQAALNAMGTGTVLASTMTTDTTFTAGVYSAPSFSTTAGTTLTLNGQGLADQAFVFNIADILSTGASTRIVLENFGANSSVIWNTGGYASLGASSTFIGTILALDYISVGANTVATGVGASCGGLYSASSYVSTGDSAIIGGTGCTGANTSLDIDAYGVAVQSITPPLSQPAAVPESDTWAMMLSGLGMIGWSLRRRFGLAGFRAA